MSEELEDYILAHIDAQPAALAQLERESNIRLLNGRMCSGHLQGRLLKMLVAMASPTKALELGTFSGYSALCIAEALPPDGTLDTVEVDDEMEEHIERALAGSEHGAKVRLHIADALDYCRGCADAAYDFIFIDADKRQYADYYEESIRLLRPGGFIVADNTLWYGHVIDPQYGRDRQTAGIRAFNDLVAADSRVEKVIVPVRDGLTIIRKI